MLQENNNNNYLCMERACESREALQERERGVLPIAKLLEMGSFPELGDVTRRAPVRGFRAWAMGNVCARSRRWAALPAASPAPFLQRPDATDNQAAGDLCPQASGLAHGQPGMGLGLQLDAGSWSGRCGSRQGTLGALVTVATLKASEGGGQAQTQCFLLQAKGRSYLCTAGRRRAPPPGLLAKLTSAPAVHGLGDAAFSGKPPERGKSSKQREGKDNPRPFRKWRTSCEVAFSVKGRVPWDYSNREFPGLGASQETRSTHASKSSVPDTQTSKQESPDAQICTQCREVSDRSVIGLRRAAEDSRQSSDGVGEEEMTSPASGSFACHLDPDATHPETSSGVTDQEGSVGAGMQDGLQPKSSPQKVGRFQDLLGDKSPRLGTGSKSEVIGAVRIGSNSEADLTASAKPPKETGSPTDKDPESNGGGDNLRCPGGVRGGLPCGQDATEGPRSHCCEEGRLDLATSSEGDHGSLAEVKDIPEQLWQSTLSDGCTGKEAGCKDRPQDDTEAGEGVWTTRSPEELPDRAGGLTVTNGHPPEDVEHPCESRTGASIMEESGLSDIWGGGHHWGRDGPEAGGPNRGPDNRDPILQPDNSLSRGLDSAAANIHAPPNPAPPGAMATALSSLDGSRDGASLPSAEELRQQDWNGGMVASGERFLHVEQDGDDDFGLFVQAGEPPSWDDGFSDFQQVPYGTSESAALTDHWTFGQTENPFHQSEDTWTAFSLDPGLGERQRMQSGGQWWPQKAAEEISVKPHTPFDVAHVMEEAFPSAPSSCPNPNPVLTLRGLLQSVSWEDGTGGDSGSLLDGLQDVNRIIGLKYKWAESHSQKLLLQSLHLDTNNKGHVTSSRANDSPSVSLPPLSQHTSPASNGKTMPSHDINKNILA